MKLRLLFSLCFSMCTFISFSQWNPNTTINTAACTSINNQQDARIVSDSKAGAIVSWVDNRNNTLSTDIFAQRINYAGYPQWTSNGVAICIDLATQAAVSLVESDNGGAIITWQDWRSGDRDIYAQKVDSLGNVLWTANGVAVCTKVNHQQGPKIISDLAGGAIIVWEDSIGTSWDIYAQHINSSGVATWTSGGVVVCNAADAQINPKIKSDGAGGAIITWQDKRNGIEYHIYSQRIVSSGSVAWTANGVGICTVAGGQTNPKIEMDGNGGAYIGWQDKRNGTDYDVYAQRVDTNGSPQWTTNGVSVCATIGSQSAIDMTSDLVNGLIISWKDVRTGLYQIYANKLSPAGVVQWTSNGVQVAPGINPNIIGDANGGAIITWQDSTTAGGTWNVYSQRLNDLGVKQWASAGVDICTAAGGQTSPKNVATGNGGSIYVWQDKRSTVDLDIYVHQLTAAGVVAGIADYTYETASTSYPNPFSVSTTIMFNSSIMENKWTLHIYDIYGRIVNSMEVENNNSITISRSNLKAGMYFYQIISKDHIYSCGNFTVVD